MENFRVTKKQDVVFEGVKYKAVPSNTCNGCVFESINDRCYATPCKRSERQDSQNVIFIKVEK